MQRFAHLLMDPLVLLVFMMPLRHAVELCSRQLGFDNSTGPKDRRTGGDLAWCNEHHARTCCERDHTRQALTRFTSATPDVSQGCLALSAKVYCSICDGDVGVGLKTRQNVVFLCPSLCDAWYDACRSDFFSPSGAGLLQGCFPGSLVCSPLAEITAMAAVFCARLGFTVASEDDELDGECYDGVPAAKTRGKGPPAPWVPRPYQSRGFVEELKTAFRVIWYNMPAPVRKWAPSIGIGAVFLAVGLRVIMSS